MAVPRTATTMWDPTPAAATLATISIVMATAVMVRVCVRERLVPQQYSLFDLVNYLPCHRD